MSKDPFEDRRAEIERRLKKLEEPSVRPDDSMETKRLGRVGYDFAATVIVCGGIGWFLDRAFDVQPWLFLGMIVVGFVVGVTNVVRMAGGYGESLGWRKPNRDETKRE